MKFYAKRRFDGSDLGCQWESNNTLDNQFKKLSDVCDFYAVKHYFLKCAASPAFYTFFELEDLENYLFGTGKIKPKAGDALEIWGISEDQCTYIYAKMPDENGLIPVTNCAY
jgi:hypothetical protein